MKINVNKKNFIVAISSILASFSIIQLPVNAEERTFNWPTIDGRKIAGDMNTFRSLSNEQTRDTIATRYCQYNGYNGHSNWGTVFRDWSQREALWQIHEQYTNKLEWSWKGHEGGYIFSSITCYR